ncbi:ABC transporter G family member 23-like isoform X2 [Adelges cooleyi]|uniref:ABC transporter G family member 23-like isoform X2 n=1 Tax=Adelges cooleyi TaxID=133065 RepID=UPI00217FBA76|nr:ABC transporter G family member 23-like isoform X2 [Adelges cooleyi]
MMYEGTKPNVKCVCGETEKFPTRVGVHFFGIRRRRTRRRVGVHQWMCREAMQPNPPPPASVEVRTAYKKYSSSSLVLRGTSLTVRRNTIYGLLGPSGCGKTTLLNCIVGRTKLDSGIINLESNGIDEIGYMPQDLCLDPLLSVEEIFCYFGTLFGLRRDEIITRYKYFNAIFDLPNRDMLINNLSGGQQRRVSLAVALLHNPTLLILDEPTVGLDPILSEKIWLHLSDLSSEGKTIIITTHYIEEARRAHTVGMMRSGLILSEDAPENLMKCYSCSSLEDVFLKLCIIDTSKIIQKTPLPMDCVQKKLLPLDNNRKFETRRFRAQMLKNRFLLWRNKQMTYLMLGLPIIITVFFNMAIGRDPKNINIGVINDEIDLGSCANFTKVNNNCFLDEQMYGSCQLIYQLHKRTYRINEYYDVETGRESIRKNQIWALLRFNWNYTDALKERVNSGRDSTDSVVDNSFLEFWVDDSDRYMSILIERDLTLSLADALKNVVGTCNDSLDKVISYPIKIHDALYGTNLGSFTHFVTPGTVCICMFFLPLIYTTFVLLDEQNDGILDRVITSGMTFLEIASAHSVVQICYICIQAFEILIIMYVFYDNPYIGSIATGYSLLIVIGIAGMIYGFVLALANDSHFAAGFAGVGTNFLLMCACGFIWPTQGARHFVRYINQFVPITLAIEALRGITMRGWTLNHTAVYMGFVSMVIWALIFYVISCVLYKLKKETKKKL